MSPQVLLESGPPGPLLPSTARRRVVIDTQCLLDWMVFRDPAAGAWEMCLCGGEWEWIFTSAMRDEFDHVVRRGFDARWSVPPAADLAAAWARFGRQVGEVPPAPEVQRRLRCTDPDDQKFIDLAIGAGAAALVSRDKAVLRLARRALEGHGLRILAPRPWWEQVASPEASAGGR